MPRRKTVVVFSGGLDSTVLLWACLYDGVKVLALTVDYGQRHRTEVTAACRICTAYDIKHEVINLSSLKTLLPGNSQTDPRIKVPHGHYAAESMKKTVVPNRNMILLSLAGVTAGSFGAQEIAYGAHTGDHAIYPDCRPEFVNTMKEAFRISNWEPIELLTPFINMTKSDIVKMGASLLVPMHMTYSCYEGKPDVHCGQCGTCVERKEAFIEAGVTDPTNYA